MRKPAVLHYGDTLPSAVEFEEGDMFFLRTTGELYIRTGGAWSLNTGEAGITSVNNDGTGTPLVSDTGTAQSAKIRSLSTSGNGITLAISTGGGEVELNFDKTAAGVGAPNGIASLDSSGRVVERLSYEGIPNGVPQLTAASEVAQPPSGQGFANLLSTDALAGEFFVAKSGAMYKTQGGYAGGPAILDSTGRLYSAQLPTGLILGNTARDHKIVAGVISNDGTGWAQIGSPHEAINVDSVSADNSDIIIDYTSIGATLAHTFVAVPNETMGSDGVVAVGTSVGLSQARLRLLQLSRMSGYAYYTGNSWMWLNATTGPTPAATVTPALSFDFATGKLTILGGNFASWGSATARNGPYLAQIDTAGANFITVVFRDIATGSVVTFPNTNMMVFVERFTYHQLDPTTYVSSLGNIQFMGVFS